MSLVVASLIGCVTHRDFLTTFRVKGALFDDEGKSSGLASVTLIDSGLDDQRPADMRNIVTQDVALGASFDFVQGYHWGASRRNPSETAALTVVIDSKGCQKYTREVRLASLQRSGRETVLDLGSLSLSCMADIKLGED
ncbi:MAG: hypothetical protein IPK97_15465 [Ahniella sp.]|nr:hypothetical protein [Ahniella sp.]